MKNKNQNSSLKPKRKSVFGIVKSPLFSFLLILCAAAIGLSGLIPTDIFRASAQTKRNAPKQDAQNDISESARQQIAALVQEKLTRSAGRKKMDSQLIYGIKMSRGEQLAPGLDTLEISIPRNEEGQPVIDITARVTKRLLTKLEAEGAKILVSLPRYNTLRVEISLDALDAIADLPEVIHLQPKQEAMTSQAATQTEAPGGIFDMENLRTTRPGFEERKDVVSSELLKALRGGGGGVDDLYTVNVTGVRKSEGDTTERVAFGRNNYGFDGTGIKIGIISDGVRNLATVQSSGDLGPVTVLPGQSGTSAGQCATTAACDEGTAMLEIVHDLAPGAQLYFATGLGGNTNFAQNIRDLRTAGCDIIVDDLFYFAESPFQDGQAPAVVSPTNGGVIAQAVNDVTAGGALYFSSAGNSGNKNDNTSGVWEGDFVDGGDAPAPIGAANGRIHQFPLDGATPAQTYNVLTAASGPVILNWSDPLGATGDDYDLYALNAAGTTVTASSTSTQDGNDDPFEGFNTPVAGSRIVIVKFSGAARYLRISTNRGRLTVNTPQQTSGHSTAANAFGVAATPAIGPFPNPHNSSNVVETFSSDGPRKLFYQPDGTPFTPGNVSSTGGIVRQKPDITATDGVSVTGAGGFGISFFGTSAAAPHAGAIAAIIKSANPALTPAQIRTTLQSTAIDIEAAGVDRDAGNGIVMADAALSSLGLLVPPAYLSLGTPTVDANGGNLNDYLEPNEAGSINIPLINTGIANATTVSGTLSSTTPGVTISSPARTYPDIAANGGTANPVTPFTVFLDPTFVYASDIDFVLTVTYNGGKTQSFPFKIPTGQLANISTTLDTTAPASGTNYTAATGTQTGRLNFTFPVSGCGTAKTNPATTSTLARRYDSYTFTNTSASTICVTVLLTHSSNVLLHAVAYTVFTPATPSTTYLGDGGGSTTQGAGTAQRFSFNVPPTSSFTVVVSESNQNGGLNTPYNLRVTGLPAAAVAPTAAQASVSGRVANAGGQGLANVRVSVVSETGERLTATTNAFGYYRFENLVVGQTYVFSVASKRYTFSNSTQVIYLGDELSDLNFISDN